MVDERMERSAYPAKIGWFYRLSRGQIYLVTMWSVISQLADLALAGATDWRRYLLRGIKVILSAQTAMAMFSVGWLASSEHDLGEREALIAGSFAGVAMATVHQSVRAARLALRPGQQGAGSALYFLPLAWAIGSLVGGLLAMAGVREAGRRA
jgi:hypothetical protein